MSQFVVCDDCEGKCRSNETSSCDECGIELRNGCANNPSDHSIFDGCCDICRDKCRSDDETDYDEEEDPCETCIVCVEKYDYKNTGRMCLTHDPSDNCYSDDEGEYDCGCSSNTNNSVILINEHIDQEVYVCPDHEHDFVVKKGFYNEHTGWGKEEHDAKHEKPIEIIEECAICDKRLGIYDGNYEMKCVIDNMLDDDFEAYNCCGLCALDKVKQRNFELVRKQPKKKYTFKKKSP